MVAGFKCRRRSTRVERSVESPDTLSRDCSLTKQSSSVFNQLPRSRLERVFGRWSALFSGVEGDQMLEERRKMTIDAGARQGLNSAHMTEAPDVCCYE